MTILTSPLEWGLMALHPNFHPHALIGVRWFPPTKLSATRMDNLLPPWFTLRRHVRDFRADGCRLESLRLLNNWFNMRHLLPSPTAQVESVLSPSAKPVETSSPPRRSGVGTNDLMRFDAPEPFFGHVDEDWRRFVVKMVSSGKTKPLA